MQFMILKVHIILIHMILIHMDLDTVVVVQDSEDSDERDVDNLTLVQMPTKTKLTRHSNNNPELSLQTPDTPILF